jgi:hypothetical protein
MSTLKAPNRSQFGLQTTWERLYELLTHLKLASTRFDGVPVRLLQRRREVRACDHAANEKSPQRVDLLGAS